jgi:hypothetical protein
LEYNDKNDRVYLKIQLNGENTVYKSSAELADYGNKPLNKLLEPFVDDDGSVNFDDIVGYDVTFTTKTNVSKDGNQFSNIVDIDYIYEDGANEED